MQRNTILAWAVVCAVAIAGCSGGPQTMLSPTAVDHDATALNPDGSTLKAGAPSDLSPREVTVDSLRPTLSFTNAVGRYVTVSFAHDIQIVDVNGTEVYSRIIGESATSSSHALESDLTYSTDFWWRARARLGEHAGPWSDFVRFRTLDRPGPPAPVPGQLPFAVPEACGPFGPGDRTACVIAMTTVSPWWAACQAGSGTNCHRFTRSVAAALATHDPRWGLLSKNPGEQQCSWNACGPGNGSGYGEDVVVHLDGGTLRGWDIVTGAGAPGARAGWSRLEGFRAGNGWVPVPLPLGRD
ncbi:MAG TPA: hypothetical protein VMO26_13855 [Vicinamibacterales bacterium]|nr:hypothetical protein [Vicinamibacterales bacterium]